MAPPKEQDLVDGDSGYISDESSFYGVSHSTLGDKSLTAFTLLCISFFTDTKPTDQVMRSSAMALKI